MPQATPKTSAPTTHAPASAANCEVNAPGIAHSVVMVIPSCAPVATPSVVGSASGLRKTCWNSTPTSPKPAPTKREIARRGSRL